MNNSCWCQARAKVEHRQGQTSKVKEHGVAIESHVTTDDNT